MSERRDEQYVADILDCIDKIQRYTANMSRDAFFVDEKTIDAVVRNIEIIGEAATRLSLSFKNRVNDIPWPQIIGMRHRIVHDYFLIDLKHVWSVVSDEIPKLKSRIEPHLGNVERG